MSVTAESSAFHSIQSGKDPNEIATCSQWKIQCLHFVHVEGSYHFAMNELTASIEMCVICDKDRAIVSY